MKRFHAHIAVQTLDESVDFYSQLFGQTPSTRQHDYAKWMLDDPPVNFAISARGHTPGLNHFGFQVESHDELSDLKRRAQLASAGRLIDQGETKCCYARSEKHWTVDPQGVAWEHFLTSGSSPAFGVESLTSDGACCIALRGGDGGAVEAKSACCIANAESSGGETCCNAPANG